MVAAYTRIEISNFSGPLGVGDSWCSSERYPISVPYNTYISWQWLSNNVGYYDAWTLIWKIKYVATNWHTIRPGCAAYRPPSQPGYNNVGPCTMCSEYHTYDCP